MPKNKILTKSKEYLVYICDDFGFEKKKEKIKKYKKTTADIFNKEK